MQLFQYTAQQHVLCCYHGQKSCLFQFHFDTWVLDTQIDRIANSNTNRAHSVIKGVRLAPASTKTPLQVVLRVHSPAH